MQISTNVTTHVIIFHDGSKKFINQKAYDQIWKNVETGIEKIAMGGNIFHFASISKIISLEEYYNQYPDERPAPTMKDVGKIMAEKGIGLREIINRENDTRHIESMIKGLKNYIASTPENPLHTYGGTAFYQRTQAPLELLAIMKKKT